MYLAGSEILGAGDSGFEASAVGNDDRGSRILGRDQNLTGARDSST